jgi:hypothetical protein
MMKMTIRTYDFQKNMYYDRYMTSGLTPSIKAPTGVGRVVLAYNFGVFGDNMPVFWIKRLGKK